MKTATEARVKKMESENLRMNTNDGTLSGVGVPGASALVSRIASAMKADTRNTPVEGAEQTDTQVTVTVTQGDVTQTVTATGRCAVTAEHDSVTTQRLGTKTAAIALLALTGCTREYNADTMSAALFDYQEGEPAALAVLLGVSEEALARAEDLYADLARETTVTRAATPRVYGVDVADSVTEVDAATVEA